jgi:CHAT domain-containing protein
MYKNQGKWGQAEAMYRQAMTIDLKRLGNTHPSVAVVLNKMASLYFEESKLADAERFLRGALAIDQAAYGPKHPIVAENLSNLATVYEEEGKAVNAEPMYQQALAIHEAAFGPNHPVLAADLVGLAYTYTDQQKYAQAEPLFRRALSIDEASLGPNHPDTGEAQMKLAVFFYGWDKPDQAEPFFEKRISNLMEQFRTNAAYMSEKDRLIFLSTVPGAFPIFFSFALKYHDREPDLAGKVYDSLLQEKGFIAASAAALRAKILASGDRDAIALLDKLTAKKTELAGVVSSSQGDPADRRKVIAHLQQETNQLEQELVKRAAAFTEQKTLSVATWRDVQKALKPGEAAVEFARFQFHNGKSFTSTIYYIALVVKPESKNPDFIVLGQAKELEAAPISGYTAHVGATRGISAEPEPEAAAPKAVAGNTSAAYDAFWKPLEASLATTKRVYVSPDGVLNQISMGLLADSSGKMLLEKYELHYVNSTKDLLRPRHTGASKTALLVGNPTFDLTEAKQRTVVAQLGLKNQQSSSVSAPPAAAVQSLQRSPSSPAAILKPLPGTQLEVNAVNKLLGASGWQVTAYTGDRALKEAVDAVRSPRLVHLATHGFFLSDQVIAPKGKVAAAQTPLIVDPMLRSGLFFAGADRTESGAAPATGLSDGVLTAYEASQLDLQGTELVILSACETGLGQQTNGEGVFGLRRGLQEAGADGVMMSMWSVPDQETQELMTLFYAKWLGGLEKPEALREAQLKERETVRQRYGKDLPFYWGAFVLVSR